MKHSYCSYCGTKYTCEDWPRRGENPAKGELALPGGYLDCNETWRHGGAREVFEETGISIDPYSITLETVISSTEGDSLLVFGRAPKQSKRTIASVLQTFKPNNEVTELVITNEPIELIWTSHRSVLLGYFKFDS